MKIPATLAAGDSYSWDDDPASDNYGNLIDSSQWVLKYDFRQAGVANLSVTAATQGKGWRTSLTAAQTVLYIAGPLYWQAYATKSSERRTLGTGQLIVTPNLANADNSDEFRTQAQQDLDAVQAAMRAMIAGGAVAEYTIGGRSLRKIALTDLMVMESQLKTSVAREKAAQSIANGLGNPRNMFVRFT